MDQLAALETIGFTMPTPAYLVGMILFSICGYMLLTGTAEIAVDLTVISQVIAEAADESESHVVRMLPIT